MLTTAGHHSTLASNWHKLVLLCAQPSNACHWTTAECRRIIHLSHIYLLNHYPIGIGRSTIISFPLPPGPEAELPTSHMVTIENIGRATDHCSDSVVISFTRQWHLVTVCAGRLQSAVVSTVSLAVKCLLTVDTVGRRSAPRCKS